MLFIYLVAVIVSQVHEIREEYSNTLEFSELCFSMRSISNFQTQPRVLVFYVHGRCFCENLVSVTTEWLLSV